MPPGSAPASLRGWQGPGVRVGTVVEHSVTMTRMPEPRLGLNLNAEGHGSTELTRKNCMTRPGSPSHSQKPLSNMTDDRPGTGTFRVRLDSELELERLTVITFVDTKSRAGAGAGMSAIGDDSACEHDQRAPGGVSAIGAHSLFNDRGSDTIHFQVPRPSAPLWRRLIMSAAVATVAPASDSGRASCHRR